MEYQRIRIKFLQDVCGVPAGIVREDLLTPNIRQSIAEGLIADVTPVVKAPQVQKSSSKKTAKK